MFVELQDLLKKRSLVLTLVAGDGDTIRVTVNPKPKDKDEPKALSMPFVLEGTGGELDAGFATALGDYKTTHESLEEQIIAIKADADEAVKAAKKEAAERVKAANASTIAARAKKQESAKVEPKQAEPELSHTRGLFDPEPPAAIETPAQADPALVETAADSDASTDESEELEDTANDAQAHSNAA